MDGKDYVANALRTEAPPDFLTVTGASPEESRKLARLLHALLGMVTEIGEIADVLKQRLVYGKPMDEVNLVEEHGDESWYMAIFLDALGSDWDTSWTRNIAKLRERFPKKFEAAQALNRDLAAERRALEGGVTAARGAVDRAHGHPPSELSAAYVAGYTGAAALNNAAGDPYRTAPTAPPQRHRETPPDQRHGFAPYVPCESCDDSVCLTIKTLQEQVQSLRAQAARKPCDGNFRTAEDYRDHLPCNDCNPPGHTDGVSSGVYAMLKAEIAQLSTDNNRLRAHEAKLQAERDNWKRRAEQHGCNVVDGDPDCG